jgi:hypothetical protein
MSMAIRTDSHLTRAIRSNPRGITVQVRGAPAAVASEALRLARPEVAALDAGWRSAPGLRPGDTNGPKFVSEVIPAESGPVLWVDGGSAPVALLLTIPRVIADHLHRLGVDEALISTPAGSLDLLRPDTGLSSVPRAAVLRLYPHPPLLRRGVPAPPPAEWLDRAWEWLHDALPTECLTVAATAVEFMLGRDAAHAYLREAQARGALQVYVVAGAPPGPLAAIQGYFGFGNLSLSMAGAPLSDDDLAAAAERLRALARRLAPACSQAFVTFLPTLHDNLSPAPPAPGVYAPRRGGGVSLRSAHPSAVAHLCDELAFDAYPFQVLGQGHRRRLGGLPAGAVELAEGRFELSFDRFQDWLPGSPELEITRERGREVLAACLLPLEEAIELGYERWGRPGSPGR